MVKNHHKRPPMIKSQKKLQRNSPHSLQRKTRKLKKSKQRPRTSRINTFEHLPRVRTYGGEAPNWLQTQNYMPCRSLRKTCSTWPTFWNELRRAYRKKSATRTKP